MLGTPLPIVSPSAPKQAGLWHLQHDQVLTSAAWRLPPSWAQGSEHQSVAQMGICSVLSSLGLTWA